MSYNLVILISLRVCFANFSADLLVSFIEDSPNCKVGNFNCRNRDLIVVGQTMKLSERDRL